LRLRLLVATCVSGSVLRATESVNVAFTEPFFGGGAAALAAAAGVELDRRF